jgi:hypothetical protein
LKSDDSLVPPLVKRLIDEKSAAAISFISAVNPLAPADSVLVIYASPIRFELFQGGVLQIVVNERSLMHYEKTQTLGEKKKAAVGRSDAERHGGKEVTDYGEDGKRLLRILKRIECVDYCSRRAVH